MSFEFVALIDHYVANWSHCDMWKNDDKFMYLISAFISAFVGTDKCQFTNLKKKKRLFVKQKLLKIHYI